MKIFSTFSGIGGFEIGIQHAYNSTITKGVEHLAGEFWATTKISDTQRYKMCGNAVTVNVIQAVFERIFNSTKFQSQNNKQLLKGDLCQEQ